MATMRDNTEYVELSCEYFQPWSTFVMATKLPPLILEKMIKITDEIITPDSKMNWYGQRIKAGESGGGTQMKDEFSINLEILKHENIMEFFLGMTRQYVIQQWLQQNPLNKGEILSKEWTTELTSMWTIFQRDNEYQPVHGHSNCQISAVMYLKIPEYLPDRNLSMKEDGAITFVGDVGKSPDWGAPTMTLQPQVGEFYIFSSSQPHFVYPFRTKDGMGERRSVSFNAVFSNDTKWSKYE